MKPLPLFFHRRTRAAFTLVELLAAMGVLSLLLVVVVQMINSVSAVVAGTSHHLDADSQARLAFDRMAVDFAQIVKRTDVDYYFKKKQNSGGNPGNDEMAFYSESSGYYPSWVNGPMPRSNVSLVGYCINGGQLKRLNKALVWNGAAQNSGSGTTGASADNGSMAPVAPMTFLPQTLPNIWPLVFGSANSPDMSTATEGDYQVIGESIFRMEICYLVPNTATAQGTKTVLSDTPYLVPGATPVPVPPPSASATPYNAMHDVASVVVTLAILDGTSRLIIPSTTRVSVLNAAAAVLDDVPAAGVQSPAIIPTTPGKLWQSHVDDGSLVTAGLPRRAASQVRIYERYFPLGNAQ